MPWAQVSDPTPAPSGGWSEVKPATKKPDVTDKPLTMGAPARVQAALQTAGKEIANPLNPVIEHAARAAGTVASPVLQWMQTPMAANLGHHAHGKGINVSEGTTPQDYTPEGIQKNTELATRQMMGLSEDQYNKLPGWRRMANEFFTQALYDPWTYAGGLGIGELLAEKVGTEGTVTVSRAIKSLQSSANPRMRQVGDGLAHGYDSLNFKGATKRALAANNAEEGIHQYRGLKAINNVRKTTQADLERSLISQYHDTIKGLNPAEEGELYEAVHTGTVNALPDALRVRAQQFKSVTDQLAHLSGDPELREQIAGANFELPQSMQRFEAEEPRGIQTAAQFRQNYVPTAHDARQAMGHENPDSILGLDRSVETGSGPDIVLDQLHLNEPRTDAARGHDTRSLQDIIENPSQHAEKQFDEIKDAKDKFLLERGEGARLLGPEIQRKIIESRLRSGARAISAADAEKEVTKLFGKQTFSQVPASAKQFFQETYNEPGGKEFWANLARGAIDLPKQGLFALPFRHMANIATLSFLADPSLANVLGTTSRFAKLMTTKDPEARAKIFGQAGKYGVTGTPSIDRQAGWVGRIPVIGDIYKASNHTLWAFDDAAKATRFDRLLKKYQGQGMDEAHAAYRAASETGSELIDYSNRSPLTQTLAYVAPFATYRSKAPGAVLRTAIRHPERINRATQLSPELTGGEQQAAPGPNGENMVGKSYLPLAEVMRGIKNPGEYARSSLGYPLAMGFSGVGGLAERLTGREDPKLAFAATYGKAPDLRYLANATLGSFPGGSTALDKLGLGEFKDQGLTGAIRGQTGFGTTYGPTSFQVQLAQALGSLQQQADAARKAGNPTAAAQFETAMARLKKRYDQFVP